VRSRHGFAVLVAISLLAGVVFAAPVAATKGGGGSSASDEHRRIVGYWTPGRQASAVPRDVSPAPKARPGGGGGGGGGGSVLGATWTGGGSVAKTTGKVFFTLGGVNYVCSASAVSSPNPSLVLTAGHCVHDGGGGGFATNWMFVPGYKNGAAPFGQWTATELFTTDTWANENDGFDDDAGFATVTNGTVQSLTSKLTSSDGGAVIPAISFSGADTAPTYSAFGYPAAKKYKGQTLVYCQGKVRVGIDGADTYSLPCDMTGGSSGGPWIVGPNTASATIRSLNSYGYSSLSNTMFGPILGAGEQAAYDEAADGCGAADLCVSR
jgi:V8-like Glu-specific endopeptidase